MPTYHPGALETQAGQMLQGANAAGFFNPTGSPVINSLVRRNALRNSDNARRRVALLARLRGLDPNQARVAQVQGEAASSGATQDALNAASTGQLLGNQQYFRGLYGQQLGGEQQRGLMRYQHDLNAPTLGGQIGSIVGQGAGSFLGGLGARFGAPRQQPQMTQAYDPYNQTDYYG